MSKDECDIAENIEEIASVLAKTADSALIADFFRDLFTPSECSDIAGRWALIKALDRKIPQRAIAKDLGLSLCKITRGAKELKKPDSAFARMLARLNE
jgi:TrpR family trp operon transcriptional repressor